MFDFHPPPLCPLRSLHPGPRSARVSVGDSGRPHPWHGGVRYPSAAMQILAGSSAGSHFPAAANACTHHAFMLILQPSIKPRPSSPLLEERWSAGLLCGAAAAAVWVSIVSRCCRAVLVARSSCAIVSLLATHRKKSSWQFACFLFCFAPWRETYFFNKSK